MNAAIVEADRVSNAGAKIGERLWLTSEAAMEIGVSRAEAVGAFERALEQYVEVFATIVNITDEAVALYLATAMLSIRMMVGAEQRKTIDAKASDAYGAYLRAQFDQAA